jgi:hypothetical protein
MNGAGGVFTDGQENGMITQANKPFLTQIYGKQAKNINPHLLHNDRRFMTMHVLSDYIYIVLTTL